jgi:hypothetical protein
MWLAARGCENPGKLAERHKQRYLLRCDAQPRSLGALAWPASTVSTCDRPADSGEGEEEGRRTPLVDWTFDILAAMQDWYSNCYPEAPC